MKLQHYYNEILYFSFIIILPRTTYVFRVYLTVFEKRKYETNTTVKLAFKKLTYNYSFGKREVLIHVYSQIQYETYIRCACIYIYKKKKKKEKPFTHTFVTI